MRSLSTKINIALQSIFPRKFIAILIEIGANIRMYIGYRSEEKFKQKYGLFDTPFPPVELRYRTHRQADLFSFYFQGRQIWTNIHRF
jgi:hypothetical protein